MKQKSMSINAFLNGIRSILNLLFPLITFPYVSRVLQVQGIGIYNFSQSINSYFLLIAELGVTSYAVREGAKYRDNPEEMSKFGSEVFTINVIATLASYALLLLSLLVFSNLKSYITCILIFSLQMFFVTMGTEWLYTIYEQYTFITIRSIVFNAISIILLFLFVRNSNDYLSYAAITVFATAGSNLINYFTAKKICRIHLTKHINWKRHMGPILIIFASNVANLIYVNSDVTLLGLMKNNYTVGIYSVSAKVYTMVKSLISSVLIVTVPRLSMLFGKRKLDSYELVLSKVTNTLVLITLPAMVGLFMMSRNVVLILSGARYMQSQSSLQILSCAYLFSILAWIITYCVLLPAKKEKYMLISMSISAILNIVLNLILIPFWSENAAALSTVIAEFSLLVVNFYYAGDIVGRIFISKTVAKNLMDAIIGSLGIWEVCFIIRNIFPHLIISTLLSVALSVIIYGVILLVLDNDIAHSYIDRYLNKN
ncbi:O-antigen/teichoic acid export membrane protein [Lactobacillus colini]|uniref:O-antigen/teichoic acid export membrane protein n=1 Tax=Lactobacillus colini TaxID=1819254 RepID=A0ABS4MEH4_9LACO|nr:flippase [Lactobacillus colini]MBP2058088.1 O-antigen/teichoic acid export membrane protein [Lactobacillus colini]